MHRWCMRVRWVVVLLAVCCWVLCCGCIRCGERYRPSMRSEIGLFDRSRNGLLLCNTALHLFAPSKCLLERLTQASCCCCTEKRMKRSVCRSTWSEAIMSLCHHSTRTRSSSTSSVSFTCAAYQPIKCATWLCSAVCLCFITDKCLS